MDTLRIYALDDQGEVYRLYGTLQATLKTELAEYNRYMDYKGMEWLHITYHNKGYLLPFLRVSSGDEYIEYLKHI